MTTLIWYITNEAIMASALTILEHPSKRVAYQYGKIVTCNPRTILIRRQNTLSY